MVCSDNARCNQPFRPYPGRVQGNRRILLLPFIPSDWTLHAFGMSGSADLLAHATLRQSRTPRQIHRYALHRAWCRHVDSCPSFAFILDYLQDTGYPVLAVLLSCRLLPLFGFFLLADRCEGKTNRFDIIKPAGTATLTCCILPYIGYSVQQLAGLIRAIGKRCTGTTQIACLLHHHRTVDRTAGESAK